MFTVFAPTDRAFSVVDADDVDQLLTDKNMSRTLVLRHTIPGTLYSAGMRFYQLRDAMEKGSTITLHKSNGKATVHLYGALGVSITPCRRRGVVEIMLYALDGCEGQLHGPAVPASIPRKKPPVPTE